jgi:nitrogen fixation/metabolism regulation signal transduction histidine kinase
MEHKKQSKSEKQYLRGVIHNLSLQRWTDQEITDYLHEKGTNIARTTVNSIKNQIEKQAENWYIELRQSRYKFIATYKERLDSLLSYQKKLNDILDSSKKEETKIRAINALQSIELDIFNIFKQLPDLRIEDVKENDSLPDPDTVLEPQVWGNAPLSIDRPRALSEDM